MGNLKLSMFLAYKSIFKGNRWALAMIVMVMSLSFANLLLTPSIMLGVTETINRQQVDALYGNIVIDPPPDEYYLSHASRIEEEAGQIPEVVGVSARLDYSALVEYHWLDKDSPSDNGNSGNWAIVGIDPDREAVVTTIHEHVISGSYLQSMTGTRYCLAWRLRAAMRRTPRRFRRCRGPKSATRCASRTQTAFSVNTL